MMEKKEDGDEKSKECLSIFREFLSITALS